MDIRYTIISVIILSISYVAFYFYNKKYIKYINLALEQKHHKKMISPTRLIISIVVSMTFVIILFNFIPIFHYPNIDMEGKIQDGIISSTEKDYNESYYERYDLKLVDNGYIVAYNNNQMYCNGYPGTECQSYNYSASLIRFYNNSDHLVWSIGGNLAVDINILYDHYQFQAWAIDQIDSGNFVSFGKYVNLDNNLFGIGILVIDHDGNILNLIDIDITLYDIVMYGSHANFDILSTNDGGFVIKYHDIFWGSFVIKYDGSFNEEWNFTYNDNQSTPYYSGIPISDYTQTLFYTGTNYYILRDNQLTCLDQNGQLKWDYTKEFNSISGIQIIDNQIYMYGAYYEYYAEMDTLLKMREGSNYHLVYYIYLIDNQEGTIEKTMTFDIGRINMGVEHYEFFPRYLFIDEDGQVNLLFVGKTYFYQDTLDYYMFVIQFNHLGDYQGFAVFNGAFTSFNSADNFGYNFYKLTAFYEENIVTIYSPLTLSHTQISYRDITFDHSIPSNFPNKIYTYVSYSRVFLNNFLLSTTIFLSLYIVISLIRLDMKRPNNQFQEKDGRDFWDEVYKSKE